MSFSSRKKELISLLNAKAIGDDDFPCRAVEFDSRNIKGGELFVALKGELTHGHQFLDEAARRGAALFLVEDEKLLTSFAEPERLVVVEDTLRAFWGLATHWRRKLRLPTIGITGSVGKTTVKEMVAAILLVRGPGNYALKSFNNHVGVPYTLLRSSDQHQWCVIEMGMNSPGEIARLSEITEPDVAVVTTVAPAHIGAFGSLDGIAREKLSIVQGLAQDGALVINDDNEAIRNAIANQTGKAPSQIVRVGTRDDASVRLRSVSVTDSFGIRFMLTIGEREVNASMQVPGRHNAMNAAIASSAVLALFPDFPLDDLRKGLEQFRAPLMRLSLKTMKDGRSVMDDSYNANPASMEALLAIAGDVKAAGRKVGLILGDMLELGDLSASYHRTLGEQVAGLRPEFVICVGNEGATVAKTASEHGVDAMAVPTPEEAAKQAVTKPFDVLFVKGSRGVQLDKAVNALLEA